MSSLSRVPFPLQSRVHTSVCFLGLVIPKGMKWNLSVILILSES